MALSGITRLTNQQSWTGRPRTAAFSAAEVPAMPSEPSTPARTPLLSGLSLSPAAMDSLLGLTTMGDSPGRMTNAQLAAYGEDNDLPDVADHVQVDDASSDRSRAGIGSSYSSSMNDPTLHDFISEFQDTATYGRPIDQTDGTNHTQQLADELLASRQSSGR